MFKKKAKKISINFKNQQLPKNTTHNPKHVHINPTPTHHLPRKNPYTTYEYTQNVKKKNKFPTNVHASQKNNNPGEPLRSTKGIENLSIIFQFLNTSIFKYQYYSITRFFEISINEIIIIIIIIISFNISF